MDGVPMITQCPILPFSTYRYKVYPENAGTYFYHAHSGITTYIHYIIRSFCRHETKRHVMRFDPFSLIYLHVKATAAIIILPNCAVKFM